MTIPGWRKALERATQRWNLPAIENHGHPAKQSLLKAGLEKSRKHKSLCGAKETNLEKNFIKMLLEYRSDSSLGKKGKINSFAFPTSAGAPGVREAGQAPSITGSPARTRWESEAGPGDQLCTCIDFPWHLYWLMPRWPEETVCNHQAQWSVRPRRHWVSAGLSFWILYKTALIFQLAIAKDMGIKCTLILNLIFLLTLYTLRLSDVNKFIHFTDSEYQSLNIINVFLLNMCPVFISSR